MRLSDEGLNEKGLWEQYGYALPKYNRDEVRETTKKQPIWIHFGAGNIFRAFQTNVVEKLLNQNVMKQGLIVAEGYDPEILDVVNRKQNDLSILVTLKSDGNIEKKVLGSVVESLKVDTNEESDFTRLREIFQSPTLQMVSFTITEKGYSLVDGTGNLLPDVSADLHNGPSSPVSYLGKVVSLLYVRFLGGADPIAMVSMDNCSHNGTKLYEGVHYIAETWEKIGKAESGFTHYIEDRSKVSFPWSMIDKITPRPDESVLEILKSDGIEEITPIITAKNTYVAPFVNAEESEYLVIEDWFPNGKPPLDKGGVIFAPRETVDQIEKMKVCTCLNPLHTALAIFGCLLSYKKISDEMMDMELKKLVEVIGYEEGLPVACDPLIMNPKEFLRTVLEIRIPNPFMPDTPQRIATDTSQKLAIRYGETIKAYMKSDKYDVKDLKKIPLVLAGWCRYLMGVDDQENSFTLSPDPMIPEVCRYVEGIRIGGSNDIHMALSGLLSKDSIFGVDLYEAGLGELVEQYFAEMIREKGAIRSTLKKYLQE